MMSATFVTFSKETSTPFSTIFYSIKLTIKLRTSDRLIGKKKATGGVIVNLVKVLSLTDVQNFSKQ